MSFSSAANPNPQEETPLQRALRVQVESNCRSRTLTIINCDSLPLLPTAMLQCSAQAPSHLESPRTRAIRKNHKQERTRRVVKMKTFETICVTQDDFIRSVLEHTSMINIPSSHIPGQPPALLETVSPGTIIGFASETFDVPGMRLQASDPEGKDVNTVLPLDEKFFRHLEEFGNDMSRGLVC
ncbi:hypothetical protein KP509_31G050600 [Ceratopteris richardii]|uniref:Uncharacterized protein n=1 Tax=Ceratopteris richardii TaxID=49495 RepID=A0A8T2QYJ9_CERRI|nr:hypothetical protein KP509_31G050600 [Ceratopteris richardii]